MKERKLTVTLHIGGKQVERLSAEQIDCMAARLTQAMSLYYTAHPDEFKNIKD